MREKADKGGKGRDGEGEAEGGREREGGKKGRRERWRREQVACLLEIRVDEVATSPSPGPSCEEGSGHLSAPFVLRKGSRSPPLGLRAGAPGESPREAVGLAARVGGTAAGVGRSLATGRGA